MESTESKNVITEREKNTKKGEKALQFEKTLLTYLLTVENAESESSKTM